MEAAQPVRELRAHAVLVGERQRGERARRVLAGDEVLDEVRRGEGAALEVGPAHGRVGDRLLAHELREVEEAAHASGVRPLMDLEEETLAGGHREEVRVVRATTRPALDERTGERAA